MKILVLTKRQPMNRDLVERPYGRFYYVPYYLAERGHQVRMLSVAHRPCVAFEGDKHGLHWFSASPVHSPLDFTRSLKRAIFGFKPDWVFGFSDTYYGIAAVALARRVGARSLVDAYDNYCAYVPRFRALHRAWFASMARADMVTVAGPSLTRLIQDNGRRAPILELPMSVDPVGFLPMPMEAARAHLGLEQKTRLIGYLGSVARNRGIEVLFRAMELIRTKQPDVKLLITGRVEAGLTLPNDTIALGYIPDDLMPVALNAVNCVAVINRSSEFGNYSYPIKLYEAMSCNIPIVASATESTKHILRSQPECLVQPENSDTLANALISALRNGRVSYQPIPDWKTSVEILEKELSAMSQRQRG